MPNPKSTHRDSPVIAELLERCAPLWARPTPQGELTAYATAGGLVVFLDFPKGGWTMLTECPSNTHAGSAVELDAMVNGFAGLRERPKPATLDPGIMQAAKALGEARGLVTAALRALDNTVGLDNILHAEGRRALDALAQHFEVERG